MLCDKNEFIVIMKLQSAESENIEYKESLAEKDDAGAAICSIANKNGGSVYFGIKNNSEIMGLGTISEKTIRDISNLYFDNLDPKVMMEITSEEKNGKKYIKIIVPKSQTPYHTYKRIPYIRIGTTTQKMSQDEYQRRLIYYKSAKKDYSSTLLDGANLNDLSPKALEILRNLLQESGRYKVNIDKLSNKQLLTNLLLMQGNKLTVAALVLLGKEASLPLYLPQAEVRYGYKTSEDEIRNEDTEIYTGGYLLYYQSIWEKINIRNLTLNIPLGLRVINRKAFEEETIREAINNAIAHRDYLNQASVFIFQYPSKICVRSPGGFPEGVTIENIIDASTPRNKLIGETLARCGFVEHFGNGVNLMYKNQLSLGKLPPNYSKSDDTQVTLELNGKIQDLEFAKYVLVVAEQRGKKLNDKELILLNKINNNEKITATQITDNLLELDLIEKIGYGKYILSKKYYSDIDKKWKYTQRKGLSKNKNKSLILQHLEDFIGAKKRELMGALKYELNDRQLNKLLEELKTEGKIYFDGKERSKTGVWKLSK